MNLELIARIQNKLNEAEAQAEENKAFFEKHKAELGEEAKKELIAKQQKLVKEIELMRTERDNYIAAGKKYKETGNNDDYSSLLAMQYELVRKYGANEKVEVVTVREPKKGIGNTILKSAVAGLVGAGVFITACLGLRGCTNQKDQDIRSMLASAYISEPAQSPTPTPVDDLIAGTPIPSPTPVGSVNPDATLAPATVEPIQTPAPTDEVEAAIEEVVEELPFETYGQFTDAYNQDQVDSRAQWYFDTYLKNLCYNGITFKEVNAEKLGRVLTMINGEFVRREDGSIDYNKTYRQDVGNTICSIWNFASFQQMGDQIQFVPMAPLFEDGSLAQEAALKMDSIMLRVVNAIRSGNHDEFRAAAEDFGTAMLNMCVYIDFNGQYVNMYHTDASHGYSALIGWYAQYISTIFEYSQKYNIDICFDYCYNNNTEETDKMSLSELFDMLVNGVIPDHVAARAGTLAQYIEAHRGHSLYRDFADRYEIYFEDKFDKEPSGFVPRLTPEQ